MPHQTAVLVCFRNILFTFEGKFLRCSSRAISPRRDIYGTR
ncbi:hypothetical protein HMPREF1991_00604 [Hoylesella loescheii DSM 19665 = JCM 12249 = ATCC 15930]|uniref:Uncharacterized protein n=1 Tax=Hoylesella loescheii DSM 19665 = JCM 12249 = ATCC 15930 TaxID=1122985 RepID=A0A069QKB6_HOYLO|nr:hypothetical protein HMPREF1991_00604 [Hoylesella loescheii DSM 19665 = JCM 12249 = ATCC 15930]